MNLSRFPHEWLYRYFRWRTGVVFIATHLAEVDPACVARVDLPPARLFEELVARCPSLGWRGEVPGFVAGFVASRLVREAFSAFRGGRRRYYPFYPRLTAEEEAALPRRGEGPLLGVQTHLTGMLSKRWGAERWRTFLELLLASQPGARIVLLDTAASVTELVFDPRISTTRDFDIAQSIRLVQRLDLLISVDSWSKYIAAGAGVPQVIIVADQRREFPLHTPELVARVMDGLCGDPGVTVIGFEDDPPRLTLPAMTDLRPEELLAAVLPRVRLKT